jgi:hypothetical protein
MQFLLYKKLLGTSFWIQKNNFYQPDIYGVFGVDVS